jgi:hypothetical protein
MITPLSLIASALLNVHPEPAGIKSFRFLIADQPLNEKNAAEFWCPGSVRHSNVEKIVQEKFCTDCPATIRLHPRSCQPAGRSPE